MAVDVKLVSEVFELFEGAQIVIQSFFEDISEWAIEIILKRSLNHLLEVHEVR